MAESYLWHKVSEKEKEEIKRNAKKILDEFAAKLEKIKVDEELYESGEGVREEGELWLTDKEFRDITFANANLVEDESIVAEKGAWKK